MFHTLEQFKTTKPGTTDFKMTEKSKQNDDDVYFVTQRESLHKRILGMSATSMISRFPGMHS